LSKEKKPRYKIRIGRFGTYFYDTVEKKDLDLEGALKLLNQEPKNCEIFRIDDNIREITTDIKSIKLTLKQLKA